MMSGVYEFNDLFFQSQRGSLLRIQALIEAGIINSSNSNPREEEVKRRENPFSRIVSILVG